ncbi:MAG TPA: zinc ribbon domain-containing protein [Gemmatimonadales bacterium]|nr:zinc ribbon domain-containing protein [Gemmatimonadales bacterium]
MVLEIVAALALGLGTLWLLFEPGLARPRGSPAVPEPDAPEETRRGVALLALKEIEFDRETGKLSDADYQMLKSRYAAEALAALAAEDASDDPEELISRRLQLLRSARSSGSPEPPACPRCGPRPEADARFCSRCGSSLAGARFCSGCGAPLAAESRFCAGCGVRVAA